MICCLVYVLIKLYSDITSVHRLDLLLFLGITNVKLKMLYSCFIVTKIILPVGCSSLCAKILGIQRKWFFLLFVIVITVVIFEIINTIIIVNIVNTICLFTLHGFHPL